MRENSFVCVCVLCWGKCPCAHGQAIDRPVCTSYFSLYTLVYRGGHHIQQFSHIFCVYSPFPLSLMLSIHSPHQTFGLQIGIKALVACERQCCRVRAVERNSRRHNFEHGAKRVQPWKLGVEAPLSHNLSSYSLGFRTLSR